jgi:hypothetical protein
MANEQRVRAAVGDDRRLAAAEISPAWVSTAARVRRAHGLPQHAFVIRGHLKVIDLGANACAAVRKLARVPPLQHKKHAGTRPAFLNPAL